MAVQRTNVRGTGLSLDGGIKISYAAWCGLKKKKLPSVLSFSLGSYHVIGNC